MEEKIVYVIGIFVMIRLANWAYQRFLGYPILDDRVVVEKVKKEIGF